MFKREDAKLSVLVVSVVTMMACLTGVSCLKAEKAEQRKSDELFRRELNGVSRKTVKNSLFPYPQKAVIGKVALVFAPCQYSIADNTGTSKRSKGYVEGFRQRWRTRFGQETSQHSLSGNAILEIVIATSKTIESKEFPEKLQADFKKLQNCPSKEQAYVINCSETPTGGRVSVLANEASGIYYALLTLDRLVDALSDDKHIVVPESRIVDWPDIPQRGIWGSVRSAFAAQDDPQLKPYSQMKLNAYYGPHLWTPASRDGKVSVRFDNSRFERARNHNVEMVPILQHLDYLFGKGNALFNMRHIAGKPAPGKEPSFTWSSRLPWCYANPESARIITSIFEESVRNVNTNTLWVWPSEEPVICHCKECKGDMKKAFQKEFEFIVAAWKKARAINPSLKINLITTQSTERYNLELVDYLSKEVGIDYYHSGRTYQVDIKEPILSPDMLKIREKGYSIGALPLLSASHHPGVLLYPFDTPLLAKVRMQELHKARADRVIAWIPPDWVTMDFNMQALAEFSWNAHGRTPREFVVSWAQREGIGNPKVVADVICMLEYPERALGISSRAASLRLSFERMVSILLEEKPKYQSYYDITGGYKQATHAELTRVLAICDKAIALADTLENKRYAHGARLLKQWHMIVERYMWYVENKKKPGAKKEAVARIIELANEIPVLWERWIDTRDVPQKSREYAKGQLNGVLKEFHRLRNAN